MCLSWVRVYLRCVRVTLTSGVSNKPNWKQHTVFCLIFGPRLIVRWTTAGLSTRVVNNFFRFERRLKNGLKEGTTHLYMREESWWGPDYIIIIIICLRQEKRIPEKKKRILSRLLCSNLCLRSLRSLCLLLHHQDCIRCNRRVLFPDTIECSFSSDHHTHSLRYDLPRSWSSWDNSADGRCSVCWI